MPKDPYRYFRIEARELMDALSACVLEIEKVGADAAVIARALRAGHTLKGAARVVRRPDIADLAHEIEDLLEPLRAGADVTRDAIVGLFGAIDAIEALLPSLGAPSSVRKEPAMEEVLQRESVIQPADGPSPIARPPSTTQSAETVRVEVRELDHLLAELFEGRVEAGHVRGALETLEAASSLAVTLGAVLDAQAKGGTDPMAALARVRSLADELRRGLRVTEAGLSLAAERLDRSFAATSEHAERLRLVPVSSIFGTLTRAVRDAADVLGKTVELTVTGGDVRVDGHLLHGVREALLHIVRNAVGHGIEREEVRLTVGKAPVGLIEVSAERRGDSVVFTCTDDGAGIDVEAVKRSAIDRGVVTHAIAKALSKDEAMRLVFRPGLTTAKSVGSLAGRGVGLDVAETTMHRLRGRIDMTSAPGRGTTFRLAAPATLALLSTLGIDVLGRRFYLPSPSVVGVVRLAAGDVFALPAATPREAFAFEGDAVPVVRLARLLRLVRADGDPPTRPSSPGPTAMRTALVLGGDRRAAVIVDAICGARVAFVRPVSRLTGRLPFVAGALLEADGHPELVLDADALVAAVLAAEEVPEPEETNGTSDLPILVIDDSLTTRMLEESILESAGYRVDAATSGEEGLAMVRARRYGLIVVDAEMPGMSGFDFLEAKRADAALEPIPAVMVTSLGSAADRQRGLAAGARDYIVKAEFEQGRFLRIVRELLGR